MNSFGNVLFSEFMKRTLARYIVQLTKYSCISSESRVSHLFSCRSSLVRVTARTAAESNLNFSRKSGLGNYISESDDRSLSSLRHRLRACAKERVVGLEAPFNFSENTGLFFMCTIHFEFPIYVKLLRRTWHFLLVKHGFDIFFCEEDSVFGERKIQKQHT